MMDSNEVVRSVKKRKCYTNTGILFFVVSLTLNVQLVRSFAYRTDETGNNLAYEVKQPTNIFITVIQSQFPPLSQSNLGNFRHAVRGKPPNMPTTRPEITSRFNFDPPTTPDISRGTSPPSLWHDSNPKHYDFSKYDNPFPKDVTEGVPVRRNTSRQKNDASVIFPGQSTSKTQDTSPKISGCVWAIYNCCTASEKVSYNCFETHNCHAAFWDLNPCSRQVQDNTIEYVNRLNGLAN